MIDTAALAGIALAFAVVCAAPMAALVRAPGRGIEAACAALFSLAAYGPIRSAVAR